MEQQLAKLANRALAGEPENIVLQVIDTLKIIDFSQIKYVIEISININNIIFIVFVISFNIIFAIIYYTIIINNYNFIFNFNLNIMLVLYLNESFGKNTASKYDY